MLSNLIRFEWTYQIKQVSFIVFTALFFSYGVSITANELGEGMALINANSPYRLSFFIAVTSVLVVLASMILCVNNVLRDKEYNFDAITANLALEQQLFSRFIVVFLAGLLLVCGLALGLFVGLMSPTLDPSTLSSFQIAHYSWPWLIFALPNVFICTTVLFAVTAKFQQALVTYLTGISLFGLFCLSVLVIGAPIAGTPVMASNEVLSLFALIDPFGTTAFFQQTQFWTPLQKNQQVILFSDALLVNRLLWLSISFLVLSRARQSWRKPQLIQSQHKAYRIKTYAANFIAQFTTKFAAHNKPCEHSALTWIEPQTVSVRYQLHTFKAMLSFEVSKMFSDWPFRLMLLLWSALVLLAAIFFGRDGGEFSSEYPTTSQLIGFLAEPLSPFALLILTYYCAEKVWQERLLKMDGLIDSLPIKNISIFAAKLLSLAVLPALMIVTIIVIGISYQAVSGYYRFELGHYLSMFYFFGLPLFIHSVWLMFIQTHMANTRFGNKYLGIVVSGLSLVLFANLTLFTGLEHPLLQFNQFPSLLRVHTALNGYGLYATKFHWFSALWGTTAVIIFIFSVRCRQRVDYSAPTKL